MGTRARPLRMVVVDATGLPPADLEVVDGLARLQLLSRRLGACVRVEHADERLRALLRFAGLADTLLHEPRGQPEGLEQLGEQEVVDRRDPSA